MNRQILLGAMVALTGLVLALTGCQSEAAAEAREVVLRGFDLGSEARVVRSIQVDPLPQEMEIGVEEVWCVNVTFTCWSCDYGEFLTCSDSRLAKRIDGEWEVFLLLTEEDQEQFEARGCDLMVEMAAR